MLYHFETGLEATKLEWFFFRSLIHSLSLSHYLFLFCYQCNDCSKSCVHTASIDHQIFTPIYFLNFSSSNDDDIFVSSSFFPFFSTCSLIRSLNQYVRPVFVYVFVYILYMRLHIECRCPHWILSIVYIKTHIYLRSFFFIHTTNRHTYSFTFLWYVILTLSFSLCLCLYLSFVRLWSNDNG